jgi:hypothetical protein
MYEKPHVRAARDPATILAARKELERALRVRSQGDKAFYTHEGLEALIQCVQACEEKAHQQPANADEMQKLVELTCESMRNMKAQLDAYERVMRALLARPKS